MASPNPQIPKAALYLDYNLQQETQISVLVETLAELVSILPNFTLPLWWCSRNFYQTLLYILFTRIIILTSLRGRLIGIALNNTVASLYQIPDQFERLIVAM
jgi:hypothetical protein